LWYPHHRRHRLIRFQRKNLPLQPRRRQTRHYLRRQHPLQSRLTLIHPLSKNPRWLHHRRQMTQTNYWKTHYRRFSRHPTVQQRLLHQLTF